MQLPEQFRPAYQYDFLGGRPQNGNVLNRELWLSRGVVYARTDGEKVVYIGVTDHTLRRRITAHVNGIPTSSSGKAAQYRQWAEGRRITIVAFCPPPVALLGYEIKVHRAIEAHLIAALGRPGEPDWFVSKA